MYFVLDSKRHKPVLRLEAKALASSDNSCLVELVLIRPTAEPTNTGTRLQKSVAADVAGGHKIVNDEDRLGALSGESCEQLLDVYRAKWSVSGNRRSAGVDSHGLLSALNSSCW